MGFGYLFLGYLIAYVLYFTVQAFGVGGLALLIGYGAMLLGLVGLTGYQRSFAIAKWLCLPLLLLSLYRLMNDLGTMFLWDLPIFESSVVTVLSWVEFAFVIIFQFAILYGVREIAAEVELLHIATKAVRNAIFVSLYAVVYLFANGIFVGNAEIRGYFSFPLVITELVYLLFNLLLLLSCTKNICAEGQEDVPKTPHRFEWLNRLDRSYERTRQKNIDDARAAGEALVARRNKKREEKRNRSK